MKRPSLLAAALVAAVAASPIAASAADAVTLQLKWVADAQFAGYLVARDLGLYAAAGLDVTIIPGGPDLAPTEEIEAGAADVIVEWMPAALAARQNGLPLVNIAQPFRRSGLELTCRKDTGIATPADLRGHRLGVWFSGNEFPFLAWMNILGIPLTGGPDGITTVQQDFNVEPLLNRNADCISTMSYNEYWQVIEAGIPQDALTVFRYEDQGVAMLEDGLWVVEDRLADPAFVDRMARFVRASMAGWDFARQHPDETLAMIMADDAATHLLSEEHQARMLSAVLELIGGGDGRLDEGAYERTVDILLSGGPGTVISARPVGAWTHLVTDAAGLN